MPPIRLKSDSAVFASKADPHFHIDRACAGHGVAQRPVTAPEFEKRICPRCGAGAVIEE